LSTQDLAQLLGWDTERLNREMKKAGFESKFKTWVPPQMARGFLESRGFRFPKQVVSFQMLKGGVAKTTSALNFGWRAAMYGARVLMIDLDQQANLTFALGVEA